MTEGRDYIHTKIYTETRKDVRIEIVEFDNGAVAFDHEKYCSGFIKDNTCICSK